MGQQQLLLLIVAIVVVLLAVVAGLTAYDQQRKKSEVDTVLNRSLMVAQAAIEWRARDDMYGGGDGSYAALEGQTLDVLGLSPISVRSQIAFLNADDEHLEIVGVSMTDPEIGVRVVVVGGLIESSEVELDSSIVIP